MEYVALGKSNLLVSRTAFGAMSLDCDEIEAFGEEADEKACILVRKAYESGINFFDTSHSTEVCERRLGVALHGIRQNVMLATKSSAKNGNDLRQDLESSMEILESDFIDLYQIESLDYVPVEKGSDGIYDTLIDLKKNGLIRHFGFTTEKYELAKVAVESGLYEVVQFPFNLICGSEAEEIVKLCEKKDIGCIAMQPLNGGILNNIPLAFGFLSQYEHVVPVWGVHTTEELDQILYFVENPPIIDETFKADVEKQRDFFN